MRLPHTHTIPGSGGYFTNYKLQNITQCIVYYLLLINYKYIYTVIIL